jgi:protocatechuate 3,4-dioxygenase beta subunit
MLAVALLALLFGPQDKPAEKCALSGIVIDSVTGEPLSKVEVALEPLDHRKTHVAVTTSDAKGRFRMVDLDAASYHLKGKRTGYLEMYYGAQRADSDGAVVRLEAGGSFDGIEFKLTPSAVIAGTVRDSDGEPIEGAHVVIARRSYWWGGASVQGLDSTDTDDRGEYRFRGLAAGKYYIGVDGKGLGWDMVDHSAGASPSESIVPTLYPGVSDLELAPAIEVFSGKRLEGVDVTMRRSRVFRVSGRVTGTVSAERQTVEMRDVKNAGIRDHELRATTKNGAGDFEFREVPPGTYEVTVESHGLRGSSAVIVGANDVEGVRLTMGPGAEIKLRFTAEGPDKPDVSGIGVFLTTNGINGFAPDFLHRDEPTLRNVPPGRYVLQVGNPLRDYYVKSARTNEADILADGLTVTGPGRIDIEAILASDGGRVEGVVRDKDQKPFSGATIVLVPDQRSRFDRYRSVSSDQNGHYEFAAVAPGGYKLFAWDDVEAGEWRDPDFLRDYEKQGEKLTLEPKAQSTVDLHLAVRADVR